MGKVHIGYFAPICHQGWMTFVRDKPAPISHRWDRVTCRHCLKKQPKKRKENR